MSLMNMLKQKEVCPKCKQLRYMTRHHVKDSKGRKTGEIEIMCRDCHDEVEEKYRLYGMLKPNPPKPPKLTPNEKLQLDYMSGLIPFYATRQAVEKRATTIE